MASEQETELRSLRASQKVNNQYEAGVRVLRERQDEYYRRMPRAPHKLVFIN